MIGVGGVLSGGMQGLQGVALRIDHLARTLRNLLIASIFLYC
jgi:hypothetical protein